MRLLTILFFVLSPVSAYASLPNDVEDVIRAHPSTNGDRYRENWEDYAVRQVRQYNRRASPLRKLSPAEGSPRLVPVKEALELLRKDANGLAYGRKKVDLYLAKLAQEPKNIALYVEFQPRPGTPDGIVYIPLPRGQMFGKANGFSAMIGFNDESRESSSPPTEKPDAAKPVRVVPLSEASPEATEFFAITHAETCGKSAQITAAIRERKSSRPVTIYTIPVDHELVRDNADRLPKQMGTPMLLQIEDGQVTGFQTFGEVKRTVDLAVTRALGEPVDPHQAELDAAELRESPVVSMYGIAEALDLAGEDLDGVSFKNGVIFSSDFQNADLRGASLEGARIYNSDFSGAKIAQDTLDGSVWVNSICPDGKPSDPELLSCNRPSARTK